MLLEVVNCSHHKPPRRSACTKRRAGSAFRKSRTSPRGLQEQHIVGIDHGLVRSVAVRFPDLAAIERRKGPRTGFHVGKPAQPDETVRTIGIPEGAGQAHAQHLLAFDEFALEQPYKIVAPSRLECVLAQLEDVPPTHLLALLSSMRQFVSQVLPPSGEKACSQCAEFAVIFDQTKRTLIGLPLKVSSPSNVPSPFSMLPNTGGSILRGSRSSSHQIAQVCVFGS